MKKVVSAIFALLIMLMPCTVAFAAEQSDVATPADGEVIEQTAGAIVDDRDVFIVAEESRARTDRLKLAREGGARLRALYAFELRRDERRYSGGDTVVLGIPGDCRQYLSGRKNGQTLLARKGSDRAL